MKYLFLVLLLSSSSWAACISSGSDAASIGEGFVKYAAAGETLSAADLLARAYYEPEKNYSRVKLKALRIAEKVHLYGSLDELSLERVLSIEAPKKGAPLSQAYVFFVDQADGEYYLGLVFRKVPDRPCLALDSVYSASHLGELYQKLQRSFFLEDFRSGTIFNKLWRH